MLNKLILLVFSAIAVTSDNPPLLIASDTGIEVRSFNGQPNGLFVVLPFSYGANDVDYHPEHGEIYAIMDKSSRSPYQIVRVKLSETNVQLSALPNWCNLNRICKRVLKFSNITELELVVELNNCWEANNLIVDWLHNNIYWTCDRLPPKGDSSTINTAAIDGSNIRTILHSDSNIESVDIDHYDEVLFSLSSHDLQKMDLKTNASKIIHRFHEDVISKISLDTQKKIIYVIVHSRVDDGNTFLGSLDYEGQNFKKHYKSKDRAWRIGPRIMNSVVHWISDRNDWIPTEDSNDELIKMKTLTVPKEINQWRIIHFDDQKIVKENPCRSFGCSHNCYLSHWFKTTCECPSAMKLDTDNKTCLNVSQNHSTTPTAAHAVDDDELKSVDYKKEKPVQRETAVKSSQPDAMSGNLDKTEERIENNNLHTRDDKSNLEKAKETMDVELKMTVEVLLKMNALEIHNSRISVQGSLDDIDYMRISQILFTNSTKTQVIGDNELKTGENNEGKTVLEKTTVRSTDAGKTRGNPNEIKDTTKKSDIHAGAQGIPESEEMEKTLRASEASAFNVSSSLTEGASTVATASTGRLTLICIVVFTIGFSILLVAVLVRRRSRTGSYQASSSGDSNDIWASS